MNVSDLTRQAAVLKTLLDAITERLDDTKQQAEEAFKATGTSQAIPSLPDGTKIATVTYAGGDKSAAIVADDRAFEAWVMKNHPEQCELVVRPEFRRGLLDVARAEGEAIDPATGEAVPGITVQPAKPYVSIRFKAGAKEAVAAAWRDGQLSGVDIVPPAAVGAPEGQTAA